MKPTYEELLTLVEEQRKIILFLRRENEELKKRVLDLEERLKLNSSNSSKPPSTDQKKNKKAPKPGALKGHPGHFRQLFSENQISKKVFSSIDKCIHCGCTDLVKKDPQCFQQVDLPKMQPLVTQIECEKATCKACGKALFASYPPEYARGAFGPNLISAISLCSAGYRLSKRSIQSLMKTFFHIDISLGSIAAMEKRISKSLLSSYEDLKLQIDQSKVAYVDETTFRQCATTQYVWTATTKSSSFLKILPRRNIASLDEIRPRNHPHITVSDRYGVYNHKKHQYCLAHIQRDFKRFSSRSGFDKEFGERAFFEIQEVFSSSRLSPKERRQRIYYRKKKLKNILYEAMHFGSETLKRFAKRLLKHYNKLFLFLRYPEVECTNNAAERTLRHIVLWRKTSYGTQSDEGSRFLERAITIWMTLKKQGQDVFSYFVQAYKSSYNPNVYPPKILVTP